jgi:hypothetical protein
MADLAAQAAMRVVDHGPIGNAPHDSWAAINQSDIRELATACHRFVAGLPRFTVEVHCDDAHLEAPRIPLIVFARRVSDRAGRRSMDGRMPDGVPGEGGQFAGDGRVLIFTQS